jgi:hypothetical protein
LENREAEKILPLPFSRISKEFFLFSKRRLVMSCRESKIISDLNKAPPETLLLLLLLLLYEDKI